MGRHGRPGLFTTLRALRGRPWLWSRHRERLVAGARALGLPAPDPAALLREVAAACGGIDDARVRIRLVADGPPRVEARPWMPPDGPWTLVPLRLEPDPELARLKTDRRTVYDHARGIAGSAGEPLLVDARGRWLESAVANVFLRVGSTLWTPPADGRLLPGVARAELIDRAPEVGLRVVERTIDARLAAAADGCFVTNAVLGVWPVALVTGVRAFPENGGIGRVRAALCPGSAQSV